jgi:phage gp36-like protein
VAPPVRQKKYDAALFFLKEISAGEASLEALGITPSGASREAADLKSAPRVFNRDRLGEW